MLSPIRHFGPRLAHKPIDVAINGANFGKTIISKYTGVICDLKNKKFTYRAENPLFCAVSVYGEQLYLPK
jgi:hypothetical protein